MKNTKFRKVYKTLNKISNCTLDQTSHKVHVNSSCVYKTTTTHFTEYLYTTQTNPHLIRSEIKRVPRNQIDKISNNFHPITSEVDNNKLIDKEER